MNLYIILPALLMAVPAIAGIAYFAHHFHWMRHAMIVTNSQLVDAQERADRLLSANKAASSLRQVSKEIAAAELAKLEAEVARLRADLPTRDPKTGRFAKVAVNAAGKRNTSTPAWSD